MPRTDDSGFSKDREIVIIQNSAGVHAETYIEGRTAILNKILVKTHGSGLFRTADYLGLWRSRFERRKML